MIPDSTPAINNLSARTADALIGYLAPEKFTNDLITELGSDIRAVHGRLVLAPSPRRPAAWAANVWLNPVQIPIRSINHAAKTLRSLQRHWASYAFQFHRRTELIAAQIPPRPLSPTVFPPATAANPGRPGMTLLGSWMLLDEQLILAATDCSSPFPNGEITFQENRDDPPSRAYLKLWELFTRLQAWPKAGDRCVDLGASPGGWTWALQQLGASVIAVDKTPLEPRVARLPRVETRQASAFGVEPDDIGPVDWLFSDVACYPERLLKLVQRWLDSGLCRNMVCTLKFQGKTDHATARAFAAIPGSHLQHLHHNGHELTWYLIGKGAGAA